MMRFIPLCLLGLLPLTAMAQERARTCRILCLGDRGSTPENLVLFDGKKTQKVSLPRLNLSQPYTLPPGALTLGMLTEPLAEGQAPPAGMPTAAVGEGMEQFYLVLTGDPTNKVTPVKMQVIDASGERFKAGQMMWFNLTPVEVSGTMGTQKVTIKPRSREVTDAPIKEAGRYSVDLSYKAQGGKSFPVCKTQWLHEPAARSLVFLTSEAGTQVPRVMSFRDDPPPAENKP